MVAGVMTYMDIAFVAVLLIAGIVGAVKGFAKQFFSFISIFVILLVAGLLCEWLGDLLYPVFGHSIDAAFEDWIISKDTEDMLFTTAQDWTQTANIDSALSSLGIPALFNRLLSAVISPTFKAFGTSAVLSEVLPPILSAWTVNTIAFVSVMLIMAIIMIIVKRAVFRIVKKPGINGVNRLLGFIVSVLSSYVSLSVILMLFSSILTSVGLFTGIQTFLGEQAALSANGYLPIFHFMYNYNFIGEFIIKQFLMIG